MNGVVPRGPMVLAAVIIKMRKALILIVGLFIMPVSAGAGFPASSGGGTASGASASDDPRAGVPRAARRDADKLIRTLKSTSGARVRAQAALVLKSFKGDPAVVKALMWALKDEFVMVRTAAARSLAEIAPLSVYPALCELGMKETDPLAVIWIRKAALRAAGAADTILVKAGGLECQGCYRVGESSQHLQSGLLNHLLSVGGYSIGASFDFTTGMINAESPPVEVSFSGKLRLEGTGESAGGILEVVAYSATGFMLWQSTVEVDSVGRGPSPHVADKFDDEFTIKEPGLDARFAACIEAGRKAAVIFDDDIRGGADVEGAE